MTNIRLGKKEYALIFREKHDKTLGLEMRLPKMKDDEIVPEVAFTVVALALLISGGDKKLKKLIERKVRDIRTLAAEEEGPGAALWGRKRPHKPGTMHRPGSRRRQK